MSTNATSPEQVASTQSTKVQSYVDRQIEKTRKQVKSIDLTAGVLMLVVFVIGFFLLAAIVDAWIWPMSQIGRWVGLIGLIGGLTVLIVGSILPLMMKRINPDYAAKMIEEVKPGFYNSLLNYVSLRRNPENVKTAVLDAVSRQAATDLSTVPDDQAVDRSKVIRIGYILIGATIASIGYWTVSPKSPLPTIPRILFPASDFAKPSVVTISDVEPGDAHVFFGDPFEVTVRVRGAFSPEDVQLIYSTDDGRLVDQVVPMVLDQTQPDLFSAQLAGDDGIRQSLSYRVVALDGISRDFKVTVEPKPAITIESVKLIPPIYTGLPTRTQSVGAIEAAEGTQAHIHALANLPIESANLELLRAVKASNEPDASTEYVRVSNVRQMLVKDNQADVRMQLVLDANREKPLATHYRINFVSTDGDQNQQPNIYPIRIIADLAPEIRVLNPSQSEVEIPLNGTLPIDLEAMDLDYQISSIQLVIEKGGRKLFTSPIKLNYEGGSRRRVDARHLLRPDELGLEVGDQGIFFARAKDNRTSYFGDDQPDPNVTRTDNFIFVITETNPQLDAAKNRDNDPNSAQDERQADSKDDRDNEDRRNEPRNPGENDPSNAEDPNNAEQATDDANDDPGNDRDPNRPQDQPPGDQQDTAKDEPKQNTPNENPNENPNESQQPNDQSAPDQPPNEGEQPDQNDANQKKPDQTGEQEQTNQQKQGGSQSGSGGQSQSGAEQSDSGQQQSDQTGSGGQQSPNESSGGNKDSAGNQSNQEGSSGSGGQQNDDPSGSQSSGNPSGDSKDSQSNPAEGGRQDSNLSDGNQETLSKDASPSEVFNKAKEFFDEQEKNNPDSNPKDPSESKDGGTGDESKDNGGNQTEDGAGNPSGDSGDPTKSGDSSTSESAAGDTSENPETGVEDGEPGSAESGDDAGNSPESGAKDSAEGSANGGDPNSSDPQDGNEGGNSSKGNPSDGGSPNQKPPGEEGTPSENPSGKNEGNPDDGGQNSSTPSESDTTDSGEPGKGDKPGESGTPSGEPAKDQGNTGDSKSQEPGDGSKPSDSSQSNPDEKAPGESDPEGEAKSGSDQPKDSDAKSGGGDQPKDNGEKGEEAGKPGEGDNKPGDSSKPSDSKSGGNKGSAEQGQPGEQGSKEKSKDLPMPKQEQGNEKEGSGKGDSSEGPKTGSSSAQGSEGKGQESDQPGEAKSSADSDSKTGDGAGTGGGPTQSLELDKKNQQHAQEQAALNLEKKLAEQKDNPDQELLDRLGWNKDQLKKFVERWEAMKAEAEKGNEKAKRRYQRAVQSLNLQPSQSTTKVNQRTEEVVGTDQDGEVNQVPPRFRRVFESFQSDLHRMDDK